MLLLETQNPPYTKPLVQKNKKPELSQALLCESDWVVCHVTLSHFSLKDLITVITGGSFHILALGHIVLHWLVTYNCDFIWDKLWNVFKLKCLWAFNFYMNTNRPLCEDLAVPPRRGTWRFQVWEGHRATGSNKLLSSFMCKLPLTLLYIEFFV